jgi:crotonobetainyl-CoA:carnitine CoA-transferase CaiB-like acyl-CoA transferase
MSVLDGVRVLDFGVYIAGPYCAALLADLGADVIRVERPKGGDDRYVMPVIPGGEGALFLHSNRGKRAITLDISKPEGQAIARRLIARSDVVIANFSPSALKRFGLDYESVKAVRKDVILTTVSAYGAEGELKDAVGFDGVGQAVSGALYLTGEPGKPFRSATSYVDFSTALSAAYGTLAALIGRMRTGEGSHVETSLVGTALNITAPILMEHASGLNPRAPTANRAPIAGPSDVFRASDGWFIMQVQGPKMFKRWAELVGRPELYDDPRFASDPLRGRNGEELSTIMADWAAQRTVKQCLDAIGASGLAAGPVLRPDDILANALGVAQAFMSPLDFPRAAPLPTVRPPARLSRGQPKERRRAPLLGEQTEEVLAECGFSREEI